MDAFLAPVAFLVFAGGERGLQVELLHHLPARDRVGYRVGGDAEGCHDADERQDEGHARTREPRPGDEPQELLR